MNVLKKLYETAASVFPIMIIVLLLGFTIVPIEKVFLFRFLVGGVLLILGLTIFLVGVDLGIQPMGEKCGAELTKKKSLPLLLSAAFVIGFIVTVAEPDIQVFATQVKGFFSFVNKGIFTCVIAGGVGLFITIGLLRTMLNISIKWIFFILYAILFAVMFMAHDSFVGIAFDSGGATTGPMTVPFIMALGLGVSAVRSDNDNSFGLTGICSIGPVMAVLIYSVILKSTGAFDSYSAHVVEDISSTAFESGVFAQIFLPFLSIFNSTMHEAVLSIFPLLILFVIFQVTLFKLTARQIARFIIGFVYSFVGLTIFLVGVNGGFSQVGAELGKMLGAFAVERGGVWYAVLICVGLVFGAIIVCAEPAVWVLSEQVESVSGGTIKRKFLLIFLAIGTAIAIGLALWKAVSGFDLKFILIPGYVIAAILMIFCPTLFSGIAFDSGGVASGPLTSTFVLSFTLGAASCSSNNTDSFGVIALVAMMPIIAIQVMGIIYKLTSAKQKSEIEEA